MTLTELNLKRLYHGVDAAREELIIPALKKSIEYKRGTGYFSVSSLIATSEGVEELIKRGGTFSLLLGTHDVPKELFDAQKLVSEWNDSEIITKNLKDFLLEVESLSKALEIDKVETIAIALRDGFMKVKLAKPVSTKSIGIFHIKRIIFSDEDGNSVVATGSPNETMGGLELNFEDLTVFKNWDYSREYAKDHIDTFSKMWNGEDPDLKLFELDDEFIKNLFEAIKVSRTKLEPLPKKTTPNGDLIKLFEAINRTVPYIPYCLPTLRLLPHQEFSYSKSLSRWPIRILLGDEVGLGKTIEMGSILFYLLNTRSLNRVLILAPKNLLVQLQDELLEKFQLNFYRWESSKKIFIDAQKNELEGSGINPESAKSPELMLVSSQWARGSANKPHLFSTIKQKPDLLIVDEAHSARRPEKGSNSSPTLMFKMLQDATKIVPHIVLMTATPMQINIDEYLGLLEILGTPKTWLSASNFTNSLKFQLSDGSRIPLENANTLTNLLISAITMQPEDSSLKKVLKPYTDEINVCTTAIEKANVVRKHWNQIRPKLIELNPASNLTVRNTRKSLEKMGYEFPVRKFVAPELKLTTQIINFQSKMEDYLRTAYGSVEEAFSPSYENSKGFVISVYQQRIASSLWAAYLSLNRRKAKLEQIRAGLSQTITVEEEDLLDEVSDFEEFEIDSKDSDRKSKINNAAIREITYLNDLLSELDRVEDGLIQGDPKISSSVDYINYNVKNKKIIVFSRYTDTLESLIKAFEESSAQTLALKYGYYVGGESWIKEIKQEKQYVTKKELRQALDSDEIRIIFCSDAASEGLNLQSANTLINIDVPWNPGRLEQRIGRIARLGQKSKEVTILNYWYPGSVESKMYSRLLERRDLYELAVGAFPEIFSKAIKDAVLSHVSDSHNQLKDPILELEELRENIQRIDLEKIWGAESYDSSKSKKFISEIDSIVDVISKSKTQYGLENYVDLYLEDENPILGNDIFSKIQVRKSANQTWNEIYSISDDKNVWLFAVKEGEKMIPIPLISLTKIIKSALGMEVFKIENSWRDYSWIPGKKVAIPRDWLHDFPLTPEHGLLKPISESPSNPSPNPVEALSNPKLLLVGEVLSSELL
jgi:SNF2 family DNA or RNA helicase